MLLILGGVAVAGCVVTGVCMIWLMAAGEPEPVTPADKGFLFPVAELHESGDAWIIRLEAERYTKTRYREQHVELTYSYEHPLNDLDLRVDSRIIVLPTPEEADQRAAELTRSFQSNLPDGEELSDQTQQFQTTANIAYLKRTSGDKTVAHFLVHRSNRGLLVIEVDGDVIDDWQFADAARRYLDSFTTYLSRFE